MKWARTPGHAYSNAYHSARFDIKYLAGKWRLFRDGEPLRQQNGNLRWFGSSGSAKAEAERLDAAGTAEGTVAI